MLFFISNSIAQYTHDEKHIEVSLRMIGHQVLLHSGDSTSRVLPIIKSHDQYKIEFDTEFEFTPEDLVATVNRVVLKTKIANSYIVEVEACETKAVVYSYEMENLAKLEETNIIPCKSRVLPKACYSLLITLKEVNSISPSENKTAAAVTSQIDYVIIALVLLLFAMGFFMVSKKKKLDKINPNLIPLGEYLFDTLNAELLFEEQKIELSSKESELLVLLYNAVNTTLEKEEILHTVWGYEADYVGRTLDVFISKLRKKLEADSSVKIVNIRGVGYKLVLNT